jgi:hypothetical protein
MKASLFHKEKDANIFQQETFHQFRKELRIKSTLVHLLSEHEQKEQEP